MTQEEYNSIEWKRGNRVMLTNRKEYSVRKQKQRFYSCILKSMRLTSSLIITSSTAAPLTPSSPSMRRSLLLKTAMGWGSLPTSRSLRRKLQILVLSRHRLQRSPNVSGRASSFSARRRSSSRSAQ